MTLVIHEVIEEARFLHPDYEFDTLGCDEMFVYADRTKIGTVLSNLTNNAVKYSPAKGLITILCKGVGEHAQISVSDQGIGIHPEDVNRLFERFYRVESTKYISGFGIGLYLSAEIIRAHHGEIWVESEVGAGSIFHFKLPAHK